MLPPSAYTAPTSDVEKNGDALLMQKMLQEQRLFWSCALAFTASLVVMSIFLSYGGSTPSFIFATPGVVAGLLIKALGKLIEEKKKVLASVICGLTVFAFFLFGSSLFLLIVLPCINIGICAALSRRHLTPEQERTYFKYRTGRG